MQATDLPAAEIEADPRALSAHAALNRTGVPYPEDSDIPTLFRRRVAERPDAPAVVHRDRRLSYAQLDALSSVLAARLTAGGVRAGEIIGVCVDRGPEMVAALLAVVSCGAAYLPFSAQWPDTRLAELFAQCDCRRALTDRAGQLAARFPGLVTVPVDGAEREGPAGRPAGGPPPDPDGLAYVNFTSGSTGRPKGVRVQHRAVVRLVSGAVYAELGRRARVLQLAPVTFDAATFEIWGALLTGGVCVLYPSDFIRFSELERVLNEEAVTAAFLTTALFNSILDETPQVLDRVARILTGGEAHSVKHIDRALARYGPGRLTSVYGPTESTTFATFHPVLEPPDPTTPVPIGTPIQNTRAYVVDRERLCAAGETGELLLAGPGLSPGYLGMPEATAERFVARRIGGEPERLYRTGDLVLLREDGVLVFQGRQDDQVKINGYRIEPGEIAHHLTAHPEVRQSFVTTDQGPAGDRILVAFVVPASDRCTPAALREHLTGLLPGYALPADIRLRAALPLTASGKVDRGVLLAAPAAGPAGRFQQIVDRHGLKLVELPDSAPTAGDAAAARMLGCSPAQIVESLVFRSPAHRGPVVLLLCGGSHRIDELRLGERIGAPLSRADADFVRRATGFPDGSVPPFGHREPVTLLVDGDLLRFDELWAAAGSPRTFVRLRGAISELLPAHTVVRVR